MRIVAAIYRTAFMESESGRIERWPLSPAASAGTVAGAGTSCGGAASLGIGAVAALVNNLPASVWATAHVAASPAAYAAPIGLAVGALATPQGSVATLLAGQLTGPAAPAVDARRFAPLAAAGVLVATLVLCATL
jgi:hypothetical protein